MCVGAWVDVGASAGEDVDVVVGVCVWLWK